MSDEEKAALAVMDLALTWRDVCLNGTPAEEGEALSRLMDALEAMVRRREAA